MINKIMNWTFGSMFRTLGRILVYVIIGAITFYLFQSNTKASTLNTNYGRYRVQNCGTECYLTDYTNFNNITTLSAVERTVNGIGARIGNSNDDIIIANNSYYVYFDVNYYKSISEGTIKNNFLCYGSTSTSSFDPHQDYINSCEYVRSMPISNTNEQQWRYIFKITSNRNLKAFQIYFYYDSPFSTDRISVLNSSYINYDDSVEQNFKDLGSLIENSNQQIIDNINNNLTTDCGNVYEFKNFGTTQPAITTTNTNDSITVNGNVSGFAYNYFTLKPNTKYYFKLSENNYQVGIYNSLHTVNYMIATDTNWHSFTTDSNTNYSALFFTRGQTITYKELIITEKNEESYCLVGSKTNKIDEVSGGIKGILNFLSPQNLIHIIVPTEPQFQELIENMQNKVVEKMGILGLPVTIYTSLAQIVNTETEEDWCINWNAVKVPNFEDHNIINEGQYCFNEMLQNETLNNFRNISMLIIGALIILQFVAYLYNSVQRVLDAPERENHEYISTVDMYDMNDITGEATNHRYMVKRSKRV